MQPHQQRVVLERDELSARFLKLSDFVLTNPLYYEVPIEERTRLNLQRDLQARLLAVLDERIASNFE